MKKPKKPSITAEQAAQLEVATLKNIVDKVGAGGIPTAREMEMLRTATTDPAKARDTGTYGPKLNIRQLSKLTGRTRETIGQRLAGMPHELHKGQAKLYDTKAALEAIYIGRPENGGTGGISLTEAQRQLAIARTSEIALGMTVTRRERIDLESITEINERVFSNVAGIVKASKLTEGEQKDIFAELRGIASALRDRLGEQ